MNKNINIKRKKQKSFGFCNTKSHTANKVPTSRNIGKIIDDDLLAEFLQAHSYLKSLNKIDVLLYFVNHWLSPKFNI